MSVFVVDEWPEEIEYVWFIVVSYGYFIHKLGNLVSSLFHLDFVVEYVFIVIVEFSQK